VNRTRMEDFNARFIRDGMYNQVEPAKSTTLTRTALKGIASLGAVPF
jgi:hypothetical protein